MNERLRIKNQQNALLCVADNAEYGYSDVFNDLNTGTFTLPARDPDNDYCAAHNFVEMPDGDEVRMFRILQMPSADIVNASGTLLKQYQVEHVAATLLDDLLFGYHEIGGTGVFTADVARWILSHQTVARWQLGVCEFSGQFPYKFENNDLLSALLSLGNVLAEPYEWTFDTTTTPWTVNLRHADSAAGCGVHYQRNMVQITKSMDATNLATRLYCLGYGEGINQLTIKEVNGGVPYLEADTVSVWGVKCAPFVDTTIESAATLKACGMAALEKCKNPAYSYTAKAIDWHSATGFAWDAFKTGKLVRVMDDEDGISFDARIIRLDKPDVRGDPHDVTITISNAIKDVSDSLTTLATRVGVNELYSQGATIFCPYNFADNASADKPAKFKVLIPNGCVRVNQMPLSWELEPFRAYETGAAAGGASVSTSSASGGGTRTSSAGGDTQITEPQHVVSYGQSTGGAIDGDGNSIVWAENNSEGLTSDSAGGGRGGGPVDSNGNSATLTATSSAYESGSSGSATGSGGGGNTSSSDNTSHSHSCGDAGSHYHTITNHRHESGTSYTGYTQPGCTSAGTHDHSIGSNTCSHMHYVTAHTHTVDGHTHTIGAHSHSYTHYHAGTSHTHGLPAHRHYIAHRHSFNVSITIPGFTINLPAHTHTVTTPDHSHDVTISDHTHDIQYGIYEGATANAVTIRVDGAAIPTPSGNEVDVAAYLSTDANGKITRGTMHTIEIVPNGLTRIAATLFVQMFVQSVGGSGSY